jgi:hypothetical protein
MADLRGEVEVTQRLEGRVVDVTLTRAEAELLFAGKRVELVSGHDDVRFTDETVPEDDGEPDSPRVERVYLRVIEEIPDDSPDDE